jgi:hypothetical protein
MAEKAKLKVLYHIKKETRDGEERTFFNRCGRGFINKDGSINIFIEALPTGITEETVFNLRDYVPKEKKETETFEE